MKRRKKPNKSFTAFYGFGIWERERRERGERGEREGRERGERERGTEGEDSFFPWESQGQRS